MKRYLKCLQNVMQIEYTEIAIIDLTSILDIISRDSPRRALAYVGKIKSAIELLALFPNLGVTCKSRGLDDVCRVMVFEHYLIFYTLDEIVTIRTIIHTSKKA